MSEHLPRFAIAAPAAVGDVVTLADDEARHARVRRLALGEPVALFDERGHSCVGEVSAIGRDRVVVRVTAVRPPDENESALDLTLAIGLLKADKLDWVIEKATELGVRRLQPFASEHTLAQPSAGRQARWQQIARSAAKQCGRSRVPTVAAPCSLATVLAAPGARLLLAEQGPTVRLASLVAAGATTLIVGAEGGFSASEIAAAHASGAHLIGLGPRILRAETAAIAAVALCQARWGDL